MSHATVGGLFERTDADGRWERVARAALVAACRVVEQHATWFSRKDFTQRQPLAILVLMKLKEGTCRGVTDPLRAMPGYRVVL